MAPPVQLRGSVITDHRGRPLALMRDSRQLNLKGDLPNDAAARVRTAVNRGYFGRWRWRAAVMIATMFALTVGFLAISPHVVNVLGGQRMAGWMGLIVPGVFGGTAGLIVWGGIAIERLYAVRRLTNALLNEGHCPRCLYSLNGLRQDDDDCTVCPECSAAWRTGAA